VAGISNVNLGYPCIWKFDEIMLMIDLVSVTPPQNPQNEAGVFWTTNDCYGYFFHLLNEREDQGGCRTNEGSGVGSLTTGTGNSLAGTKFDVAIVKAQ